MTNEPLKKRRLGRTGFMVTPLGLGGAHLGRTGPGREDFDDDLAVRTVHRALELGLNVIDTAPLYGESQRRIGLALDEWYDSDRQRGDLIISTKTGSEPDGTKHYSAEWTRQSVEKSLELLKTDYLDIVLVHDPPDLAPVFETGGALETLLELKSEGVIRAIGLGARPHEFHRRCIESGDFDVSLTFCDYNLLEQSAAEGVLKSAAREDVGIYNGAAVMLGLLSGDDPRKVADGLGGFATEERVNRALEIYHWCGERDVDILALNLQFCLRERRIASTLLGAANPAQIEADVEA
ncbi:MAG: aldo/keto reductase, partial [Armatimonadota bacterium]